MERPAPLDGTEWQEIAEGSWFCGVYRYRFDFEAIIRLNENGRYEWATRLVTEASGKPDCEDSGDYATLPRAEKKVRSIFEELMTPSLQGGIPLKTTIIERELDLAK